MTNYDFDDHPARPMGFGFSPETFGFAGMYPVDHWAIAQTQYAIADQLVSGAALDKKDERTKLALYPDKINVWDFVCEVHATMLIGESGKVPHTLFTGLSGKRSRDRAAKYTAFVDAVINRSNPALFWSIFYNANVYGGYGVTVRYDPEGRIVYEGIHPMQFYPVLDSAFGVIEYFIHRVITHSEARWVYGVEIPQNEVPHYVEHWDPESYTVKINHHVAYYRNHTPMQGPNPFKKAPAVYVPHLRKVSEWGVSQILGVGPLGLDFNARVADTSDSVRDMTQAQFWGYNINTPREVLLGRTRVWNIGEGFDPRAVPVINALPSPANVKDGQAVANWLWDLVLHLTHIPGVALGIDEGSQRSGQTLRSRFWTLVAHCMVERLFADNALNELAGIAIAGGEALGVVGAGGLEDTHREQVWPDMLPQERLELVNEMVSRRSTGLISQRTAIEQLGDVRDVDEELGLIQAEQQAKLDEQMALQEARQKSQPKEKDNDRVSEENSRRD